MTRSFDPGRYTVYSYSLVSEADYLTQQYLNLRTSLCLQNYQSSAPGVTITSLSSGKLRWLFDRGAVAFVVHKAQQKWTKKKFEA